MAILPASSGGGPNDTLPTMPSDFKVSVGNAEATLTFTPPADNYAGAIIVRKAGGVPANIYDGTKLHASSGTYIDSGLTNGTEYFWRLFPYNAKKQYQTDLQGAVVSGTPMSAILFSYTGEYERVNSAHPVTGQDRYYLKLLTSGEITFNQNIEVDMFLQNGGYAGGRGEYGSYKAGGQGGHGGSNLNVYAKPLQGNTPYNVIIGAGGIGTNAVSGVRPGGITSFGDISVPDAPTVIGGAGGYNIMGAVPGQPGQNGAYPFKGAIESLRSILYGASGGGGGVENTIAPGAGGTTGAGAGAGYNSTGRPATANTGSGGGGGSGSTAQYAGGPGGSGVAIVLVGDWSA